MESYLANKETKYGFEGEERDIHSSLMKHIFQLEEQLVSQSYDDLDDLLADNYLEFGSTGKIYDKKAQLDRSESNPSVQFTVTEFDIQCLAADVVLATYRTHKHNDGEKFHLGIKKR